MKLNNKELLLLDEAFDLMVDYYNSEIKEIRSLDDSYYEARLKRIQHRRKQCTINELREKDVQKEIDKIREVKELKRKLLLSDNHLLVISNMVNLTISDK